MMTVILYILAALALLLHAFVAMAPYDPVTPRTAQILEAQCFLIAGALFAIAARL